MWDEDLGAYWGLVRVDVVGPPEPMPWGGAQGFRRTGRFTTKDFRSFSPAQQVFHGRQGYEICKAHRPSVFQHKGFAWQASQLRRCFADTIQPFRLPSYRPGYYLATAMFYNTTSAGVQRDSTGTRGVVNCELLQTTDFGQSWSRLAKEGVQFIPRGEPGSFDSNTLCKICDRLSAREDCRASEREDVADTAWTGDQNALLDPQNNDTTLFYYSGGNGPHSGQRDDSIGLARSQTHAFAGLRAQPGNARSLRTGAVVPAGCERVSILASFEVSGSVNVSAVATEDSQDHRLLGQARSDASATPEWFELQWADELGASDTVALRLDASPGATVFALRSMCVKSDDDGLPPARPPDFTDLTPYYHPSPHWGMHTNDVNAPFYFKGVYHVLTDGGPVVFSTKRNDTWGVDDPDNGCNVTRNNTDLRTGCCNGWTHYASKDLAYAPPRPVPARCV